MHKKFLIFFLLLFVSAALYAKPQVIFIHGWQFVPSDFTQAKSMLQEIFPDHEINFWKWNASSEDFGYARRNAEKAALQLAGEIAAMPAADQKELILVGHSLGGMITVKTMSHLANQKIKIDRGIFLGSAIPDNDPAIASAITGSIRSNINVYNPQDFVLRDVYGAFNLYKNQSLFALGAFGYAYPCKKSQLFQIQADKHVNDYTTLKYFDKTSRNHLLEKYLACLQQNIKAVDPGATDAIDRSTAMDQVSVSTALSGGDIVIPSHVRKFLKAETMDAEKQWLLIRFYSPERKITINRFLSQTIPEFSIYCILDPRARLVGFTYNRSTAVDAFDDIKEQLQDL